MESKRVFGKNVEKHLERMVGKENVPSKENTRLREDPPRVQSPVSQANLSLRSLGRGLRRIVYAMQLANPSRSRDPAAMMAREIGAMMRFVVFIGNGIERYMAVRRQGKDISVKKPRGAALREYLRKHSYAYIPPRSRDHGPDLEPDL